MTAFTSFFATGTSSAIFWISQISHDVMRASSEKDSS